MPTDPRHALDQHSQQTVYAAIYEHPHGMDVRVYVERDDALNWRTAIAKAWWNNAYGDAPPPDDEIGEEYFDRMLNYGEEFFTIESCTLKTRGEAPAVSATLGSETEGGGMTC